MPTETDSHPWERLEQLAETRDPAGLLHEIEMLGVRESARALARCTEEQRDKILTTLDATDAAALVEELAGALGAPLLEHLPPEEAAHILDETPSNKRADLLHELPPDKVEAILAHMAPDNAREARRLVRYSPECAGGLMITEFLAYPSTMTTQQVVEDMRARSDEYRNYTIQYTFVIGEDGGLVGVLPLRDLLLAPSKRPIGEMMIREPLFVFDDDHLDQLAEFFEEHDFLGVPVTDRERRLVGVVRRDAVREALGERAQSDYLKAQGIPSGEELRTMPVFLRARRRLSWLSVNIFLNIIAASVIAFNEDVIAAVIALAVFLPIISDMSGCSGNQAVAVSMRELSLGLVKGTDLLYVWLKELAVGVINGVALGLLIGVVGWVYASNPFLGVVVAMALSLNTLIAVSIGGTVPLLMKRFNMDPALASGPILTTITDLCGFFLVLTFARLFMPLLVNGG